MSTTPTLRPIGPADVPLVLGLNQAHVELLAPMDQTRLAELQRWARRADVIVVAGQVAGFVITFGPGTAYDSENYRWFGARYGTAFHYLDRIVVDDRYRRSGLASAVYDALELEALDVGRLALEVNVDPPNEVSLAFHRGRGYREVGRLGAPGKTVALMTKVLPA